MKYTIDPEKHRIAAAKWRNANPEKVCADYAKYRKANLEKVHAASTAWKKAHPEKVRAAGAKWGKAHPEKVRTKTMAWRKANPEKVTAWNSNRRAKKRNAEGQHTAEEVRRLLSRQKFRCAVCKKSIEDGYHKDHIIPLSQGGSNYIRNIQLLCPTCNMKKGSKNPIKFMQEMGYLL